MENWFFIKLAILTLFLFLSISIYANENQTKSEITEIENTSSSKGNFFIAPLIETNYYGRHSPSIGGGISLGYGDKTQIGIRGLFTQSLDEDEDKLNFLELLVFARLNVYRGLFVQLNTGVVTLYGVNNTIRYPAPSGGFSIGLSAGWQFALGERFYIEPYLRAGYPYYGGVGLSLGVKF